MVKILILALNDVDRALDLSGGTLDFSPALKVVRQLLISETKDNFRRERDPAGRPWAPLKTTWKRRRGKHAKAKILQDTGKLRA
jgi:phage gpG-like protein